MTTLITGATGYIGGRLAQELVRRGESVRVLVRKGSDSTNLSELRVELIYGDITEQKTVSLALQGCDRLYHVASIFEWWLPDRNRYYHVNVEGSKNVLSKALEMQLSKVVYTSTVETIG